ncbi:hypothetical protein [Chengkuizengella marina]|uniref:Uncharacterized protein n=1 Tax=Chengkuizengella marina TaxID=2507566 RepID=A0A6N9Q2L8_9BACL|nr:hypothetical protein [Chengkuizengella marina]NBI29004.1 hypothetical protein [Chengkuizengella marina]
MGVFDESICDCCVCPMQCVLEQLEGQLVGLRTTAGNFDAILDNVNNFIVNYTDGVSSNRNLAISQIIAFEFDPELNPNGIRLKPLKNSVGECKCIEDPITNLLNSLKGKEEVEIIFLNGSISGIITNVGNGVVLVGDNVIISTCNIIIVTPIPT